MQNGADAEKTTRRFEGIGEDTPTAVNGRGGKQSEQSYRCDLLPVDAVLAIARVLKAGSDKYGENNWHAIDARDNLNHALTHIFAWLGGDRSEDHLSNAGCRILFALDQVRSGRNNDQGRFPE